MLLLVLLAIPIGVCISLCLARWRSSGEGKSGSDGLGGECERLRCDLEEDLDSDFVREDGEDWNGHGSEKEDVLVDMEVDVEVAA